MRSVLVIFFLSLFYLSQGQTQNMLVKINNNDTTLLGHSVSGISKITYNGELVNSYIAETVNECKSHHTEFKDSLPDGKFIAFYDDKNKTIALIGFYKNWLKEGNWTYFEKGKIYAIENYHLGLENGIQLRKFYEDTIFYGNYIKGLREGPWIEPQIFCNGIEKGNYINGNREGEWLIVNKEEGINTITESIVYKNGHKNGKDIIYRFGKVGCAQEYKDDEIIKTSCTDSILFLKPSNVKGK